MINKLIIDVFKLGKITGQSTFENFDYLESTLAFSSFSVPTPSDLEHTLSHFGEMMTIILDFFLYPNADQITLSFQKGSQTNHLPDFLQTLSSELKDLKESGDDAREYQLKCTIQKKNLKKQHLNHKLVLDSLVIYTRKAPFFAYSSLKKFSKINR